MAEVPKYWEREKGWKRARVSQQFSPKHSDEQVASLQRSGPFSENQEPAPGGGCGCSRKKDVASRLSVGTKSYKLHFQTLVLPANWTIFRGACSTTLSSDVFLFLSHKQSKEG